MRSIIQHLRFPFSYLLLPVFLLAFFRITRYHNVNSEMILLFLVLHILVYPSSNAYNSWQDQDKESIGLIKKPLPAKKNLLIVSAIMDALAVILSYTISWQTGLYVAIYIIISRLYSYRKIRLKKYPLIGFLVVFIFQGAWIFVMVKHTFMGIGPSTLAYAIASSCFIGSIYPLSQIYQHEQDLADGVKTISNKLGKKGTFIFSGILFLLGSIILLQEFYFTGFGYAIIPYLAFQLPSLIYFNFWFYKVIKDEREANFKHTMRMSLISATCMNAFFLYLIFA